LTEGNFATRRTHDALIKVTLCAIPGVEMRVDMHHGKRHIGKREITGKVMPVVAAPK